MCGLGQTEQAWKETAAALPGILTRCPALMEPSVESYADLLEKLEKELCETGAPVRLCGLSLGAVLALDYTLRHPEKVADLVLIGPQYKMPRRLLAFQDFVFRLLPNRAFASAGISKHQMIRLTSSMRELDFSERLGEITCPVLVVCGGKDRANLSEAKKLSQKLPRARLCIVPGAGHELNLQKPEFLAQLLARREKDGPEKE